MWFCMLLLLDIVNVEGNAPNIDYSHNMRVLKLPRETPIGTVIYRLKGSDGDSDALTFGANDAVGRELFEFRQLHFSQADVVLRKPLTEEEYTATIFVTDGAETTEVESTIIVTNGTGLPHPFVDYITLLRVPENTKLNTSIGYVTAKERENSNLPVTFELRGSEKFRIRYEFGPRGTSKAVIQLIESLDYETKTIYEVDVVALNAWTDERYDTRNVAVLPLAVVAQDVPDTPPRFKDVPPMVTVSDSAPPGTSVLNLTAEDGDYGNPRNLSYRLDKENPWSSHFSVNPQTGEVKTTRPISELADKYGGTAVYILKVAVRETTGTAEYPAQEASTQFAVVLMSRENHAPSFGSDLYVGFVAEHSAHLTAVDWAPGVSPKVHDRDQGRNSTFRLYLEGDEGGTFSVHPSSASRETDFAILVQDSSKLDYEVADPKYVEFRLVAAETEAVEPLTSTVTVRVNIVDTNDHPPMFTRDTYEAVVAEDAKKGTLVTKVTATDPDSGSFGRVRYTSLNGPIARNLKLDPETGEVTLTSSEGLDRESVPEYVLVVEAHDDDGREQRASAQLRIRVGDANDNAPAFAQNRYDAVLTADLADFTEPLVVKATDADAAGPNSNVTYEIVSGNYEQKFRIDARTGLVSLMAPLTSGGKHGYPVVLTVRAHDQGIPVQSASVPVRVHTQEYLNRSIVVVLPGNEAYLKDRREHVEKGLSELLGANVNIYSITAHNQSKEASSVRAWAVYESQPIDLVSFRRIISNLYGQEYEQLTKKEDSVRRAGNDHIFWIFIIILILLILLILLIMLCCCWRYLLRNQRPRSSSKVVPAEASSAEHSFRERQSPSAADKSAAAAANGRIPNGHSWLGRHAAGATTSKSVAVGTITEDDQARAGTEQIQGGVLRLRTPDRQLLLHEMRREPDRTARQVGNYLVVKRDAARQRHREDAVAADDEDVDAGGSGDRFRHRSALSDSFGTSRSVEYSGGSVGGGGPRRTEILYIRSPPPEDVDVGAYADTERLEATEQDGGNLRLRANRRENARRVRFSRYHKVDGGSFVLPQANGEGTSVLPRDQVWIVPRETKVKQNVGGAVKYEEPSGRRVVPRDSRLHTIQDSGEESQDVSDGGELYDDDDELQYRSKNIAANDPPRVHGGEAGGPFVAHPVQLSRTESTARRRKFQVDAPASTLANQTADDDDALATEHRTHVDQRQDMQVTVSDEATGQRSEGINRQQTQDNRLAEQHIAKAGITVLEPSSAAQNQADAEHSVRSGQEITSHLSVGASSVSQTGQYSTIPSGTAPGYGSTNWNTPIQLMMHSPNVQPASVQSGSIQSQLISTNQAYGLQGHQLVAITGMSPVFFSTPIPHSQVVSQIDGPDLPSSVHTTGDQQPLVNVHAVEDTRAELHTGPRAPEMQRFQDGLLVPVHLVHGTETSGTHMGGLQSQDRIVGPAGSTGVKPAVISRGVDTSLPFDTGLCRDNRTEDPGRQKTLLHTEGETVDGGQLKYHSIEGRSQKQGADLEQTQTPRHFSTVRISTKVVASDGSIIHGGGTTHTGAVSDSEFEAIERDLKTSLDKLDDSEPDESDSGIGPGASNLKLKKNAFIEKKSLFTIAYDGVNTQKLRSSLGSTPSP